MKATKRIYIRVTPDEKRLFNKLAQAKRLPVGAMIKRMLHISAKRNKIEVK